MCFVTPHLFCSDDTEGKRVKKVCAFYHERYGKNRSITDVDWSPKVIEYQSCHLHRTLTSISTLNLVSLHTTRILLH